MKKAIPKNRGGMRPGSGRKRTGVDPARTIRLSHEFIATIDAWAEAHDLVRSEAIRQLIELGLTVKSAARPTAKAAARAAELAAKAIDMHADMSASSAERESRKNRLLKGPSVFWDVRKGM